MVEEILWPIFCLCSVFDLLWSAVVLGRWQVIRSPQLAQAVGQLDHVLQSGQALFTQ